MAKATRTNGKVDKKSLPRGMKIFTVVSNTIKDSLGAYCTEGQEAALNKADATKYHKLHLIQAALDFDDEEDDVVTSTDTVITDEGTTDAAEPKDGAGTKTPAVAGANKGKVIP